MQECYSILSTITLLPVPTQTLVVTKTIMHSRKAIDKKLLVIAQNRSGGAPLSINLDP